MTTPNHLPALIWARIKLWEDRLERAQSTVERGHIKDAISDLQDIARALEAKS